MHARRWLSIAATAAALALPGFWLALRASPVAAPPDASRPVLPGHADSFALTGTAGCSARGCHGRIEPVPGHVVGQNEFSLWLARDRHAQAFQALQGDLGRDIARKVFGEGHPAATQPECLACHTNPQAAAGGSPLLLEEQRQGVGCEACHGNAGTWLPLHTSQEWKGYSPEIKAHYGMAPVGDPAALAVTCAGCHIGAAKNDPVNGFPRRDMNHDMIAAGHPRLAYDFSAFLVNLPPHWNEAAKKRDPDFQAKNWAVGQIVSAKAALNLLADRTEESNHRPWPEFAEYDCSACHHDLSEGKWRRDRGYDGRTPGSLPWGGWYAAMPRWLDPSLDGDFNNLATAMEAPLKNQKTLPAQARALADKLKPPSLSPEALRKMLAENPPGGAKPDWDTAEQLYLAAAGLSQGNENAQKSLNELAGKLAGPPHFVWPEGYGPDAFLKDFHNALK